MLNKLISNIRTLTNIFKQTSYEFKKTFIYELTNISTCMKTGKHLIEIKMTKKSRTISYLAEELIINNDFMKDFSPIDARIITYLAACNKTISQKEKVKNSYDIMRSKNINGKKTILIRNKLTGDTIIKSLQHFADEDLIEHLESKDAYYLGYLAGQEQTLHDITLSKITTDEKKNM